MLFSLSHSPPSVYPLALLAAAMQVYGTLISLSEFQRQLKAMRSMTVAETRRENERREVVPKKASKQRHGSGNGRWAGADTGALKRALDWLKLNDISLDIHYKKQLRSLGTVGLEWVAIDGGVTKPPKRSWLTKAGLVGRGVKHTHVGQCLRNVPATRRSCSEAYRAISLPCSISPCQIHISVNP
jgi:hypothetical protein